MIAILLINMPNGEKPEDYEFRYALLGHKQGEFPIYKTTLEVRGGKIKPMPHSKQMENRWFSDDYSKGWNDCLEELEK